MYVAVIRRVSGGLGVKTAKSPHGPLFFSDTSARNLRTFVTHWPKHITTFLCYGRSLRVEAAQRLHSISGVTSEANRRGYGSIVNSELSRDDKLRPQALHNGRNPPDQPPVQQFEVDSSPPAPAPGAKMNLHRLQLKYSREQPISMVTAYDYPSARLVDRAGVDMVLVGDSLGMVVLGLEDTTSVTMEQMVHHCRAAARGTKRAFLVCDMPFGSYLTPEEAARNAVHLVKEGRADAVKLEGGKQVVPQVKAMVAAGVAVMGHIGFTPQSHHALGGYRVQGRTAEQAHQLIEAARELQDAGCFGIVLEMVPAPVATLVTSELHVPTIGIGAGAGTSGQVQVFHDLLGLYDGKSPSFSRQFAQMEAPMSAALQEYARAVSKRTFPAPCHTFSIKQSELAAFQQLIHPQHGTINIEASANNSANGMAHDTAKAMNIGTANGIAHALGDSQARSADVGTHSANGSTHSVFASSPPPPLHVGSGSVPHVVKSVREWREVRSSFTNPLGFVPTMGALHGGHLSLIQRAKQENSTVAVSIFVNPRQFAPTEDLASYPRPWEKDLEAVTKAGVDFVFAPTVDEMYPASQPKLKPFVDLVGIDSLSEGARRPGFFRGVSTVVTKLLNIIQPDRVYFGQKDGLQCIVVRRLIEDLNFNTQLVVGETVRESDGLAMSSRNIYLNPTERQAAPTVYRALCALRQAFDSGERSAEALRDEARRVLRSEPLMNIEYVSLSSCADGEEVETLPVSGENEVGTMAAVAVKLGKTRLIDNIVLK